MQWTNDHEDSETIFGRVGAGDGAWIIRTFADEY
jgi:hypothetical protein